MLEALIEAKGIRPNGYTFFFTTGEGSFFESPDGTRTEECSGYVLTRDGRVYEFWLGVDGRTHKPALTVWRLAKPQKHWLSSGEYRRARESLGFKD